MERFGEYVLYEPLGTGSRCTVHRAAMATGDAEGRAVAIKRFPASLFPSRAEADRHAEAIARAAKLRHPNIVATHRVGRLGDTTFVEMEHVIGCSLDELLHEIRTDGPPPMEVVISLLVELVDAIGFAHQQGIVHGDIRPCHLLVDWNGHLKVLGFGMAELEQPPADCCYAAPETLRGEPAGTRADLYTLGVVGYELATGRPLFDEHMNPELRRYLASCISPPSACNRDCPPELDELLLGALATDPAERWASAEELARALAPLGAAEPARVSDWLDTAAPYTRPPATHTVPQLPRGALPEPPWRVARGTRRLPSSNPAMLRARRKGPSGQTVLARPRPREPGHALDRLLHEADTVIHDDAATVIYDEAATVIHDDARALHEAATVIRDTPPRRGLRLPLEAPSEPYAALEVMHPTTGVNEPGPTGGASEPGPAAEREPAPGTPSPSVAQRPVEVPPLPVFLASAWQEPEQTLRPLPEPRRLPHSVQLGLAFAAGAIAMYLTLGWLG